MKIISLNTWGGRAGRGKLLDFFKRNANADIFCLQEIWSAPYRHLEGAFMGGLRTSNNDVMTEGMQEISATLSAHTSYFRPHYLENYGLQMLVKKDCSVVEEGELFVHKHKGYLPEGDVGNHARNIQFVTINTSRGLVTVINFHGLWNGKGKGDCEDRLEQSDRIIDFLKTLDHRFVLCGDFNLLPDTESLKKFERFGLRNLIAEYGITSTRTSLYTKPGKFADYTFVSKEVEVKEFKTLPDEVSDHLSLYLEIR